MVGHGDHTLHDGVISRVLGDILNEGPVQLDLVDRQVAQVAEAGEAGAEVVQGSAYPHPPDLVDKVDGLPLPVQQDAFGHLELQVLRGKPARKGPGRLASSVAASRQACRNTQRPSGMICPVCSASGMKCPGETMPLWGCCQRTSAS